MIDEYLSFIRDVDRLSDKTVYDRKVWLNDFDKFLRTKGVQKIEEIQLKHIREYLASKSNLKRNSLAALITVLRSFFRCLESDFEITLGFKWQKIKTVQISLGHENVNTTQNYLHVPPKYIREQFDKFMTLRPI